MQSVFTRAWYLNKGEAMNTKIWLDKGDRIAFLSYFYDDTWSKKGNVNKSLGAYSGGAKYKLAYKNTIAVRAKSKKKQCAIRSIQIRRNKRWKFNLKRGQTKLKFLNAGWIRYLIK
jgi:hypothetical protein